MIREKNEKKIFVVSLITGYSVVDYSNYQRVYWCSFLFKVQCFDIIRKDKSQISRMKIVCSLIITSCSFDAHGIIVQIR